MAEVIVALDVPTAADADALLRRIPEARWVKVGSILMTREGPALIRRLVAEGRSVFLDLKWHDIPNTVAGAAAAAREMGVAMATVHALGGHEMMAAAADAAGEMTLVGVTVLTSHGADGFGRAVGRDGVTIEDEVARLAGEAFGAGLGGVVCSPHEIGRVRGIAPAGAALVVPGIRRREDAVGDQVRLADPATARARGATHLVVGRPILSADDPAAVLREMSRR